MSFSMGWKKGVGCLSAGPQRAVLREDGAAFEEPVHLRAGSTLRGFLGLESKGGCVDHWWQPFRGAGEKPM
ncbi:hypothetical protein MATL_G00106230 [Megalops atlanticus]|uniref:Uncharacterized protein n=1 Tax=Megalops atlanticus TaxID=7932 RepID=A0A9D3T920_MEGAT|nr:hypothetical protein MATL_G00106230 [Megalops atlanticus]